MPYTPSLLSLSRCLSLPLPLWTNKWMGDIKKMTLMGATYIFPRTRTYCTLLRTNLRGAPTCVYVISVGRFQYTTLDEEDAETPRECEQPDCLIPVENVFIECESPDWTLPPSSTPYPTMAPVMDGTFGPIPTNAPVPPEEVRALPLLVLVLLLLLLQGSQRV